MMVHRVCLLSFVIFEGSFVKLNVVGNVLDKLTQLFFFYESDEFFTRRANDVEPITGLDTDFFTGISRNDNLAFCANGRRAIQFFVVWSHCTLLYFVYEMYVKYDAYLNDFYVTLQK